MVQEFLEKQLCTEGGIELIIRELKPAENKVQVLRPPLHHLAEESFKASPLVEGEDVEIEEENLLVQSCEREGRWEDESSLVVVEEPEDESMDQEPPIIEFEETQQEKLLAPAIISKKAAIAKRSNSPAAAALNQEQYHVSGENQRFNTLKTMQFESFDSL